MPLTNEQVQETARRQVSLSFLMSAIIEPTPTQEVRNEAMKVFTSYWNRELPYAKLEEQLAVSGLPPKFLEDGICLYLNEEDVN